jgi:anti-sigma B factor antagonist
MAELNVSERQAGDITILDMNGKVTIGEGSVALRSAIRRLLGEGKKKILLNLGRVGYVDSSGIGELVSSFTAVNKEDGSLKLLNLTQKIQDLLAITKLLTVSMSLKTKTKRSAVLNNDYFSADSFPNKRINNYELRISNYELRTNEKSSYFAIRNLKFVILF